ncbi:MAG TPA: hypothetical protein VKZ79_21600 [Alphaproteobacteria bacterium]|nr:hypothetical protein [Alphaproteobacteria bacterium]
MSPRAATAPASESPFTACFSVIAKTDPGVMSRVLALFAKRGLIPSYWCSRVSDGELTIDLQMAGLDRATTAYLAACFRQIPTVRTVLTSEKRPG